MIHLFTDPGLLSPGMWKFVKVGGQYRFFNPEWKHTEAVRDGESPSEGGMLCLLDDGSVILLDSRSISLRLYGVNIEDLEKALGKKVKR